MGERDQRPPFNYRLRVLLLVVAASLMASVIAQSLAQTAIAVGVAVVAVLAIAAATYWLVRRPPTSSTSQPKPSDARIQRTH